ncbi:MAG: hypothetical protein LBL72_06835 [Candidatus Accumulibacter sp.]|jgi:hypothetical protein|nr:hypothetical protein [Accumulibacter sp.]
MSTVDLDALSTRLFQLQWRLERFDGEFESTDPLVKEVSDIRAWIDLSQSENLLCDSLSSRESLAKPVDSREKNHTNPMGFSRSFSKKGTGFARPFLLALPDKSRVSLLAELP